MSRKSFEVEPHLEGATLASYVREKQGLSWAKTKHLIDARMVEISSQVCRDPARRIHSGESITILSSPTPKKPFDHGVVIRHLDTHLVVVEKPSGISSVRHPTEREFTAERRALSPTLEEILPELVKRRDSHSGGGKSHRLRIVHRLDKGTSGLMVFARTVDAERGLGTQFRDHTIHRRYVAVIHGQIRDQSIESHLVRDRGDGRRGSTQLPRVGKHSVTHIKLRKQVGSYSVLECRLETGRTHQIRIHLSDRGHPLCGDPVYCKTLFGPEIADNSGAPRLALHAEALGFVHPVTGSTLSFDMPLPADLVNWLISLENTKS
ncbi:MAG: RluA family pseudouridine synthase [Gemmataceae bacterium]|nr:RluA family pseudouridine synthase [Gemmataceae bacterium]